MTIFVIWPGSDVNSVSGVRFDSRLRRNLRTVIRDFHDSSAFDDPRAIIERSVRSLIFIVI